jgi:hypothetical protein
VSTTWHPSGRAGWSRSPDVLHVGRMVRTKGLRDVIRALALLPDLPGVRLTSAGAGEELELCRAEAERLGVADRVRFPRPGAARRGRGALRKPRRVLLPVVPRTGGRRPLRGDAPRAAGDHCRPGRSGLDHRRQRGHQGAGHGPRHLRRRHRAALRRMAHPEHCAALGEGARAKVLREGLWSAKAERMVALYEEITRPSDRAGDPSERIGHPLQDRPRLAFCAVTSGG